MANPLSGGGNPLSRPAQRPPGGAPNPLQSGGQRPPQQQQPNTQKRPPGGVPPQQTAPQRAPGGVPPQQPRQQSMPRQPQLQQTPRPTQQPVRQPQSNPAQPPQTVNQQSPQHKQSFVEPTSQPIDDFGSPNFDEFATEDDPFTIDDSFADEVDLEIDNLSFADDRSPSAPQKTLVDEIVKPPVPAATRRTAPAVDQRMALAPAENLDEYEEKPSYIDKSEKKLKPFGKQIKVGDLDTRKDLSQMRKIIQFATLGAILLVIGFGAYKTFFPQPTMTPEAVQDISLQANGEIGFPTTRAEGFAKSFVETYLTIDRSNEASESIMRSFYGNEGSSPNRGASNETVQKIINGPIVYKSSATTPSAGNFEIAALVSISGPGTENAMTDPMNIKWVNLSVNVYYNADTESFAITPDSPTIVPNVNVKPSGDTPPATLLGTKLESNDTEAFRSTIVGFVKSFQESSESDHGSMDQYVVSSAGPELLRGLNKQFEFENKDNPESSIRYEAFTPDGSGGQQIKVDVSVDWRLPAAGSEASATYTSRYVLTLDKQSNGKYLVSKFAPFYYTEASPA